MHADYIIFLFFLSDSDVSDDGKSPRKHSQKIKGLANGVGTPLKQTTNNAVENASTISNTIQKSTRRSIENLSLAFKSGASDIRKEVRGEFKDAASEVNSVWVKVRKTTRQVIRKGEDQGKRIVTRSRAYCSDATNITALVLIIEATLLVIQVMPITSYSLGGQRSVKNFLKSGGKSASGTIPHLTLSAPNFWALLTYAFWRPIFLWSFWTVALPLFAASEYPLKSLYFCHITSFALLLIRCRHIRAKA